jgi:hypothetical protein
MSQLAGIPAEIAAAMIGVTQPAVIRHYPSRVEDPTTGRVALGDSVDVNVQVTPIFDFDAYYPRVNTEVVATGFVMMAGLNAPIVPTANGMQLILYGTVLAITWVRTHSVGNAVAAYELYLNGSTP